MSSLPTPRTTIAAFVEWLALLALGALALRLFHDGARLAALVGGAAAAATAALLVREIRLLATSARDAPTARGGELVRVARRGLAARRRAARRGCP